MSKEHELEVDNAELLEGDDEEEEDFEGNELEQEQTQTQQAPQEEAKQQPLENLNLDSLTKQVVGVIEQRNIPIETVRFKFLEEHGERVASGMGAKFGDVLFSFKEEDVTYKSFLKKITNISDDIFAKSLENTPFKEDYYSILKSVMIGLGKDLVSMVKEEKKVEETKPEPPKQRPISIEVQGALMKIKDIYKRLYTSGFDLVRPYGLLSSEGAVGLVDSKVQVEKANLFINLYNMLNSLVDGVLSDDKPVEGMTIEQTRLVTVTDTKNYYPMYQLGHLYGVLGDKQYSSWGEVARAIEPLLISILQDQEEKGINMNYLIDSLTTSLIITEFDMTKIIKLKCYVGGKKFNERKFREAYEQNKTNIMYGAGEIFRIKADGDMLEVTIMLDMKKYMSTPLFAYEAIEKLKARGIHPSTSKLIIGQDVDGNILTENFDLGTRGVIHIAAGPRSGKGVVTLNLLGTFLASDNPVIYADCKPDMASTLQDMGKKYGKKVAAYDVRTPYGFQTGIGIPQELAENSLLHGTLMYTKLIQLMLVLDPLRKEGFNYRGNKRPFFIFDEAYAYQLDLASSINAILERASDKKDTSEVAEWGRVVGEWYKTLTANAKSAIVSDLPKGGISSVWLFQRVQEKAWTPSDVLFNGKKANLPLDFVRAGTVMKLLGANLDNSQYGYGSVKNEADVINYVNLDARHFMKSEGAEAQTGQYTIFKPYLVLNESRMDSDVVKELKGNLDKAGTDIFEKVLQPNGQLHEGVGFEGFANMIGSTALDNLDNGYNLLWEMIKYMGLDSRYNSVEEYIYDCSIDSFYTNSQLRNFAKNGGSDGGEAVAVISNVNTFDEPQNEVVDAQVVAEEKPQQESLIDLYNREREQQEEVTQTQVQEEQVTPPWAGNINTQETGVNSQPPWAGNINTEPTGGQQQAPINPPQEGEVIRIDGRSLWEDGNNLTQEEQQQRSLVNTQPSENPNEIPKEQYVYRETLKFDVNPFVPNKTYGLFGTVSYMNKTTEMLLLEIQKMVGSLDRVEALEITNNGMFVNGTPFRPQFEQSVLEAMPPLVRNQVEQGNVVDLFDFSKLKKFKGLVILIIANTLLAEGRVRKEYNLLGKQWTELFKRHAYLQELQIGGLRITNDQEEEYYESTAKQGYDLKTTMAEKLGRSRQVFASSPVQNVWNSKPTRAITKAVGWTAGIKVASMVALALGPWGLVFGSIAAYSALKGRDKGNNDK